MKGGIAAAAALVALCVGAASPVQVDRCGGMTQDLPYRVRPPFEALVRFSHVALAVVLAAVLVLLASAWRRNDKRRLVVFGLMFAVVAGVWWFGPGYLEARMFDARMLPGADGWQR